LEIEWFKNNLQEITVLLVSLLVLLIVLERRCAHSCGAWLAAAHRPRVSVDTGEFPLSAFAKVLDDKPQWVILRAKRRLFGLL
jgi:hypothetical protein